MRGIWIVIAACAVLAACDRTLPHEMSYTEVRAFAAEMEQRCTAQGLSVDDPEWTACVEHEIAAETERRASARRTAAQSTTLALQRQAMTTAPRTVRCTSYGAGGTVNTTCY